jgi:hypothetical protein
MGTTPFASSTLVEHLLRGMAGAAALVLAVRVSGSHPLLALGLAVGMLAAFRGCPVCWTMGLIDTVRSLRTARRKQPEA